MQYICSISILLCLLVQPVMAHATPPKDPTWWFNLGLGAGSNFKNEAAPIQSATNAQLSFNGRFTPHTFLTVYTGGFSSGVDTRDYKSQHDIGIMYGYIYRQPSVYWSASTGICYTVRELQKEYYTSGYRYGSYYSNLQHLC